MALSGTMSNPSDWLQFYNLQNNTLSGQTLPFSSSSSSSSGAARFGQEQLAVSHNEATIATTTTTTATASASAAAAAATLPSSSNNTNSLSPEGRVTKPVRKRSRASRRTPTTLLNTDTANFRAMVQQFTGGPSTASFAPSQPGATSFGFGLGHRQAGFVNPNGSVMVPPGYSHLQLQQQQQQNPYLLSLNNSNNNNSDNQGFVQRLMSSSSSARPTNVGVSFSSDEFASQVQGQPSLVGSGRPNSNPSNENRNNSFLY